ncbi:MULTISPECIES: MerR family transcriptional regulator [unclassified Brevibacterium]|uniref:MerR family transcriptional regulator n=1 Tax=unclassified Brevibacterium TaxID=2614124 RepID=UPI0010932229|nr:MerR family transcriptional regulator [Brevibacterium sp. S22]TGD32813.1 MerR family transcriptional regulator [Brevibacterium sp. S22]
MTGHLSIGEFSTATWLSPKALRIYDSNGLLSPNSVDPVTGYRRYSRDQVNTARLISMLRRIDMSLVEIGDLLTLPAHDRAEMIARHREAASVEHDRRQTLARFLEHAVDRGSLDGDEQPPVPGYDVKSRRSPRLPVLTSTRHTSAKELPEVIHTCADRLIALASDRGGIAGPLFVIYHGQVGWESDGPIEICVPIRHSERAHRVESAQTQLFTPVRRADVQFPRILGAFDAVATRAKQLGLTRSGPPREFYAPFTAGQVPDCEVVLPVHAD